MYASALAVALCIPIALTLPELARAIGEDATARLVAVRAA